MKDYIKDAKGKRFRKKQKICEGKRVCALTSVCLKNVSYVPQEVFPSVRIRIDWGKRYVSERCHNLAEFNGLVGQFTR